MTSGISISATPSSSRTVFPLTFTSCTGTSGISGITISATPFSLRTETPPTVTSCTGTSGISIASTSAFKSATSFTRPVASVSSIAGVPTIPLSALISLSTCPILSVFALTDALRALILSVLALTVLSTCPMLSVNPVISSRIFATSSFIVLNEILPVFILVIWPRGFDTISVNIVILSSGTVSSSLRTFISPCAIV